MVLEKEIPIFRNLMELLNQKFQIVHQMMYQIVYQVVHQMMYQITNS